MMLLDKLVNLVSGLGTAKDKAFHDRHVFTALTREELEAAYRGDWVARKAIDIPPHDEVKNGRDWQADSADIELIEAEEKRLGLWKKVLRARTLARLYGGSALILGASDASPELPMVPERVGKAGLVYAHVLNRYELSAGDIDRDITSELYGQPIHWEVTGRNGTRARIHPSRVIRFVGNEVPDQTTAAEPYWGDSVLESIMDAVRHVGLANQGVAALIHEAKQDVFKIPGLSAGLATEAYTNRMIARFTNTNILKSLVNAIVIDAEEEHTQKQISFATLPDIMDRYMQAVSGAADIPTTRMLGQAPQGMNSTGDGDYKNYLDRIASGQELELRPALEPLDEVLIRSALGSRPEDVHYTWAPLWQMSEKEKAEIAKLKAETTQVYVNGALVPIDALAKATCNQLVEDGTYPGLEAALEESAEEPGEGLIESEEEAAEALAQGGGPEADRPFVEDAKRGRRRKRKKGRSRSKGFDPNQPRGVGGRWVATGSRLEAELQARVRGRRGHVTITKVRRASLVARVSGEDVRGFKHAISAEAMAHTLKKHGNAKTEAARGQIAVTQSDFRKLPRIIREGEFKQAKQRPFGPRRIKIIATLGGIEHHYVGEIRRGKRRIDMISMWKK